MALVSPFADKFSNICIASFAFPSCISLKASIPVFSSPKATASKPVIRRAIKLIRKASVICVLFPFIQRTLRFSLRRPRAADRLKALVRASYPLGP